MAWDFLAAREGDKDTVAWALRTARSLHESGDHRHALEWLRRAARNAADAGFDARAGELFVAAGKFSRTTERGLSSSGWSDLDESTVATSALDNTQKSPVVASPMSADATLSDIVPPRFRQKSDTLITAVPSETFVNSPTRPGVDRTLKGLSSTLPAAGAGQPRTYRVAFLSGPDSGCAVAIRLSEGDGAPEGAASAVVIPNSFEDAKALEGIWK